MINKKELRNEVLQLRDRLTIEERRIKSHRIAEQVVTCKEFVEADKILLYASYKSEVDTFEVFETALSLSKDVYYPKVLGKEMEFYQINEIEYLVEGYRGIYEPQVSEKGQFSPKRKEKVCVIMPGAVFDVKGNRIGYGGGFYDKYLQKLEMKIAKENISKIAVAFECQIVKEGLIASEEHDVKPDYVITEQQIYQC